MLEGIGLDSSFLQSHLASSRDLHHSLQVSETSQPTLRSRKMARRAYARRRLNAPRRPVLRSEDS
jgi:hypothetical protein